ncbi:ImmA/IrrE family metallo-endopeptidase [Gluconobacter sp. NFX36]|uniref:ImmA/IrrE family metallo-endopeptidase n=1 Tax=Gluconobacter sp. NFX36 TaxID=2819535 RepID=UPI003CEE167F
MTMKKMTPQEVLDKYWTRGILPIDPEKIARKADIKIGNLPFEEVNVSGWYLPTGNHGQPKILVSRFEPERRIRFTVAHELGHHFLQHGERPRDSTKEFNIYNFDPIETEANNFAADLLMPAEYVSALIKGLGITSVKTLCEKFDVSGVAMEIRLKKLGYI